MMGLFANLPVALAPAMGLMRSSLLSLYRRWACRGKSGWRNLLGRDWSAITDDFPRSLRMIANIPVSLRVGITSGIGLLLA